MKLLRIDKISTLPTFLLLLLLAGCATTRSPAGGSVEKTFLEFLEDGKTTRQMVILKLGQPSATFEGERILTYRIGSDENGYFVLDRHPDWLVRYDWTGTKFSLVLIFDEHDVLQKHSMVPVR
jgi:hypothetical protein